MRIQCCACRHIIANEEWDGMLDCELAREEEGKRKCCHLEGEDVFCDFELEENPRIVKSYIEEYIRQTSRSEEWEHLKELKKK